MISTAENAHAQAQSHLVHVHQPEKGGGRPASMTLTSSRGQAQAYIQDSCNTKAKASNVH